MSEQTDPDDAFDDSVPEEEEPEDRLEADDREAVYPEELALAGKEV